MRELMDKKEVMVYLNGKLTFDTLGRLTREGKIPVVRFPGIRRYFYDRAAVDSWIDSLSQERPEAVTNIQKFKTAR